MTSQIFLNKGKSYDILKPWLGEGLLLASGITRVIILNENQLNSISISRQ